MISKKKVENRNHLENKILKYTKKQISEIKPMGHACAATACDAAERISNIGIRLNNLASMHQSCLLYLMILR